MQIFKFQIYEIDVWDFRFDMYGSAIHGTK